MPDIIQINTPGPQGSTGPTGPKGDPGQLTSFVDVSITGSLFVSGTAEQGNITGSIITASGGFSGSLEGTASFATSASFATTSSFALNVPENTGFPFTGSAAISGSLDVIGPTTFDDLNVEGSFTASNLGFLGTVSASTYVGDGSQLTGTNVNPYPFTGSAQVSGSFGITGSFSVLSGSFTTTTGSFERCESEQFVSTGAGVPKISSGAKLILSASTSVQIEDFLRLKPTTSQSINTPENGNIVYDSNTNKFRGYANGAWVDLH